MVGNDFFFDTPLAMGWEHGFGTLFLHMDGMNVLAREGFRSEVT